MIHYSCFGWCSAVFIDMCSRCWCDTWFGCWGRRSGFGCSFSAWSSGFGELVGPLAILGFGFVTSWSVDFWAQWLSNCDSLLILPWFQSSMLLACSWIWQLVLASDSAATSWLPWFYLCQFLWRVDFLSIPFQFWLMSPGFYIYHQQLEAHLYLG